eukprot:scaffold20281_cov72-Attheya_sp.AAC.1
MTIAPSRARTTGRSKDHAGESRLSMDRWTSAFPSHAAMLESKRELRRWSLDSHLPDISLIDLMDFMMQRWRSFSSAETGRTTGSDRERLSHGTFSYTTPRGGGGGGTARAEKPYASMPRTWQDSM